MTHYHCEGSYKLGNITLCFDDHSVNVAGEQKRLRNKLFRLLSHLANHPNRLVTRKELIERVWDGNYYIGEKGLTHAICMLRNILKKDPESGVTIDTIPKSGYRLRIKNKQVHSEDSKQEYLLKMDTSVPSWWPSQYGYYAG